MYKNHAYFRLSFIFLSDRFYAKIFGCLIVNIVFFCLSVCFKLLSLRLLPFFVNYFESMDSFSLFKYKWALFALISLLLYLE